MWTINGVSLEARVWSSPAADSPPLLLLHEGLGSVAQWKSFPAQLAEQTGRRVIAYSRPGHGASSRLTGTREPDFMHLEAERLRLLLVDQGLSDAVLVGHSDGASIALLYASAHPCGGLVLLAPHLFVEPITVASIRAVKARAERTDLLDRLGRYHADADHIFRGWSEIWLRPDFQRWNIEAEAARITAPTLVIQGRDDEYGSPAQLRAVARAVPHADVLELGRCGHNPHRDRARATMAAIVAFVRGNSRRAQSSNGAQ